MDGVTAVESERELVLFGAFDRFNYGDLLYPLIVKWLASTYTEPVKIRVCAMNTSDLGWLGAEPTATLHETLLGNSTHSDPTILVAGGEVLSQNWFGTLLASLNKHRADVLLQIHEAFGLDNAERFAKEMLSDGRRFPWLIEPGRLPGRCRVAYNSVGGWPLAYESPAVQSDCARVLKEAEFLSVRDGRTREILRGILPSLPVRLAPDIVSLVARMWPRQVLARPAWGATNQGLFGGRYICVQANSSYVHSNLVELAQQISAIATEFSFGIVLAPFGRCTGWNDTEGLSVLQERLDVRSVLLSPDSTIQDVTAILAHAELFIGTTLHGVVVAAAYSVPAIALSTDDPKVQNYLSTWPIAGDRCADVQQVTDTARSAMRTKENRRVQTEVERMAGQNFDEFWKQLHEESLEK